MIGPLRPIALPSLLGLVLVLSSCALESPLPRHEHFAHFYDQYDQISGPDLEKLDADYKAGKISEVEYQRERTALRGNVHQKVNDLILHNHRLRENDAQSQGQPIAGAPVSTPSSGMGFSRGNTGFGAGAGGGFGAAGAAGFGGFGRGSTGIGHGNMGTGPVGRVY